MDMSQEMMAGDSWQILKLLTIQLDSLFTPHTFAWNACIVQNKHTKYML